jgi:hypothetical protein
MPLSWNEIKDRAVRFSREWKTESSEHAEAKSFWDDFFNVFGITRRRIASFEAPVRNSDGKGGFIDLLWKGKLVVEHKTRGKDLDKAYQQALDYFPGLKERDLPRYVLVSDFARFRLYDLEESETHEFPLEDLYKRVRLFAFIAGYEARSFGEEDPVNNRAAEQLGKLHDQLLAVGYEGHALEVFLVRLLFCLFAEDTSIFEQTQFKEYIEQKTSEDGSDLGMHLATLFQVLNTPREKRLTNLDEHLAAFEYINGRLFEESLPIPAFDRAMRETLLNCCALNWGRISPAIFGSLFQSIMDKDARRNLGAHYTSEVNILKALRPLFLDALRAELEACGTNRGKLEAFHRKLATIRVLDPACGCGNFLVIAYRELRLLELETMKRLLSRQRVLSVAALIFVDVDQCYGIEIEEFPAQIAQVALWLTDHQMNMTVSEVFGQYFARLPLKKSANIRHGNALTTDWREVVAPKDLTYIVGNPPFSGARFMSKNQKTELLAVFQNLKNAGNLDYVTCWYRKATDYMIENPSIRAAFVSTNSITQGEQAGILWPGLFSHGVRINFAHRTFQWSSEARGKAAVHCVIVGFALQDEPVKWLFEYENIRGEPHAVKASSINPYLVDGPNVTLPNRTRPICEAPIIGVGSQPLDDGNYLFTPAEKATFLEQEPHAAPYFKRWFGAQEFIKGIERWCLWLGNCPPEELRKMPAVLQRVNAVREFRLRSERESTIKAAGRPTRFYMENIPETDFLIIPQVSSERRPYIPIGFMHAGEGLCGDKVRLAPDATLYHFGILTSAMHMAWVRAVCGRLKSDYSYTINNVYNNYPWPVAPGADRVKAVEEAAQGVLSTRASHPKATLADLYDPLTIPPDLANAHQKLDSAADKAYGKTDFKSEAERVSYLFELYRKITGG